MTDKATIQIAGDNDPLKKSLAQSKQILQNFAKQAAGSSIGLSGGASLGHSRFAQPWAVYGSRVGLSAPPAPPTSPAPPMPSHGSGSWFDSLGDFAKHALSTFTGFGAFTTVTGALHKIKDALKEATRAAMDYETSMLKFDVMFTNTGHKAGFFKSELAAMNEELQKTSGFSGGQVRSSMNAFFKLEGIQGDIFKRGLETSADLAAFMGTEMSHAAEMLGRALQNPAQGMMLLSRAGVRLTKEERNRIKELQNSMQIEKARSELLDIVERKFGGLAKRMKEETLSGALGELQATLHHTFADVGKAMLPALKELIPQLKVMVKELGEIGKELMPVAALFLKIAGLLAEGTASLRDIGGLRRFQTEPGFNKLTGEQESWHTPGSKRWNEEQARKKKAFDERRFDEPETYYDMFGLPHKRPKKPMTDEAKQAAMDEAARREGFIPRKGKIEEMPLAASLEGTFENIEETWKRISGAGKGDGESTGEAIDDLETTLSVNQQKQLDEAKTQTATMIAANNMWQKFIEAERPGTLANS